MKFGMSTAEISKPYALSEFSEPELVFETYSVSDKTPDFQQEVLKNLDLYLRWRFLETEDASEK